VHEVKQGEYLKAIAEKYYGDQSKFEIIARVNDLEDATKLYTGMKLIIPETHHLCGGPRRWRKVWGRSLAGFRARDGL